MGGRIKNLFVAAALSAVIAGLALTLLQYVQVIPAILEAETYEHAASLSHEHVDDVSSWAPSDGLERSLYTVAANILMALGFALLLGAVLSLRNTLAGWRSGLLWGLAGYASFFVAPTLGLPAELPGTMAADLPVRQLWWLGTAGSTAAGLALMVFAQRFALKLLGSLLIAAPHLLIGAPQAEVHASLAPGELVQTFMVATLLANAVFWLLLGGLYGFFQQRLSVTR